MRRKDFQMISGFLCEALDCLESKKIEHAETALKNALAWLDEQQFHKPRGNPFSYGEDIRRKDRVVQR